jgi:hypothetical protein
VSSACRHLFLAVAVQVQVMVLWQGNTLIAQTVTVDQQITNQQKESNEMTETIIHADLFARKLKGLAAELYINDIPVARVGGNLQPWASVPVPEYLVDGENVLSVILGIGETPSTSKTGLAGKQCEPGVELWARIVRMQDGEMAQPGSGESLLELQWTAEKAEDLPFSLSTTGDVGSKFGEWKWQSADVLTLDSATTESAADFISKIADAYTNAKPDPIIELAGFKHQEATVAYPIYAGEDFGEMFKEQMQMGSEHPNWKPYELPRDQYDLRLVADGRMIEAVAKDWRPIVRMENGDFGFNMYIGKVNGEWQILR